MNAKSFVWKVSRGTQQLYIGGTVHLLPAREFPLPAEFEKAYQHASQLVFEVDIGLAADLDIASKAMGFTMYSDGRNLKSVLSPQNKKRLQEVAFSLGIDISTLASFKPEYVLSLLMQAKLQQIGMAGEGVDMHFYKRGMQDGKSTVFLETLEQHFAIVFSISDGLENDWVSLNLDQLPRIGELTSQGLDAWRRGNRDALTELTGEMLKTKVGRLEYRRMLTDRNQAWVKKIGLMIQTPETEFVLVGAMHLAGPGNVLDILTDQGYQVQQLSVNED
jgi:uncharacterized protein YbaP (TraB family)